jgi:hypothetical protein
MKTGGGFVILDNGRRVFATSLARYYKITNKVPTLKMPV